MVENATAGLRKCELSFLLNVRGGSRAIAFYQAAFGATVSMRVGDDGDVVAQLSVEGNEFWLADESTQHQNFSPESLHGSTVRLILTVENPDAVYARAIAAGATAVWPVADQDYGWRVGRLLDPFGHHWEIGKPLRKHS